MGDIVGKPGRKLVAQALPGLRKRENLDLVIANAENSADGSGITPKIYRELLAAGIDCITLGDHIYRRFEITNVLESEANIVKPVNYPEEAPGRAWAVVQAANGVSVAVISVMGRVYMRPVDCPFKALDRVLAEIPSEVKVRFVDIHAEATSEKMAMGHYCDGRASFVVGTHSHVPTADAQILPGGTAYQTDAGACADYDSVIGMEKTEPLQRFIRKISSGRYNPAQGPATVCGIFVETNDATGLATRIEPVRLGGRLKQTVPQV